ncbi:MAG: hypothetical protein Tsb009_10500 [Planctomycetaceae bacterium]
MKILLVCNSYPPHVSPRAIRWSAIAEHWAARGDEVHVVAGCQPGAKREEFLNGVHVHRVGGGLVEWLRGKLNRENSTRETASPGAKRRISVKGFVQTFLKGCFRFAHDRIWKKMYWPDYACLWSFAAVSACRKLLSQNSFDVFVTSSLPFTDHWVGLKVNRTHSTVPWVVDVGDPFSFLENTPTNNHRIYGRLNRKVERKVFLRGDAISVTNENTRRIYAELFPEAADSIQVIPPLLREDSLGTADETVFKTSTTRIRLAFIGTLHPTVRTPEHVLTLFRELLSREIGQRLELHFFGPANHCEPFFEPFRDIIGERLLLHGPISHAQARGVMSEADVLLNIGNTTTYQLPSKIVEYASTGNPILNITTVDGDSSEEVLNSYPQALSLRLADPSDIHEQSIQRVIEFLDNARLVSPVDVDRWCKPFRIDSIVNQYDALLQKAIDRHSLAPSIKDSAVPVRVFSPESDSVFPATHPGQRQPVTEIAITGATGFIGQQLIKTLQSQSDFQLRLLSRQGDFPVLRDKFDESSITTIKGDLLKPESLVGFPTSGGTLINLAYLMGRSREENLQAAINLAEVAADAGIKRLVHCSTAVVAGRVTGSSIDESTPCHPFNEYESIKLAVEEELKRRAHGRFELAILRPTAVFGPGGKNLLKLANDLKHGWRIINYLKSCLYNQRRMNAVCVSNVVAALEFLATVDRRMEGDVFLISDDDQHGNTYREIEKRLMSELGQRDYRFPRIPIPGTALGFLLRLTGRSVINPQCRYESRKIHEVGFNKPCSLDDGLHEFAEWYKAA